MKSFAEHQSILVQLYQNHDVFFELNYKYDDLSLWYLQVARSLHHQQELTSLSSEFINRNSMLAGDSTVRFASNLALYVSILSPTQMVPRLLNKAFRFLPPQSRQEIIREVEYMMDIGRVFNGVIYAPDKVKFWDRRIRDHQLSPADEVDIHLHQQCKPYTILSNLHFGTNPSPSSSQIVG